MGKTLQEILDTTLSPENVKMLTPNELSEFLLCNEIIASKEDMNMLVIEGIQRALRDDDEFPIHYYAKDEEMSEEGRVADPGPCLTDEYIENEMNS